MQGALLGSCTAMVTSWLWHVRLLSPTPLTSSECAAWTWHTHLTRRKYAILQWKRPILSFLTPVHHSWSFKSVLIILWSESPATLRSHSTAAALLFGRPTARAIIGRRGRVAQLTVLIPRSQSSAVLFKSIACGSWRLIGKMSPH